MCGGSVKIFCNAAIVSLTLLGLTGCASHFKLNDALLQRLKNRGPVLINGSNPYLASSVYLRREREQSNELKGFLEHRGTPSVLEVSEPLFGPLTMRLYYLDDQTHYLLEEDSETWIITGPMNFTEHEIAELKAAHAYVATDSTARAKLSTQALSAPVATAPRFDEAPTPSEPPQRPLPDRVVQRLETASKKAGFESFQPRISKAAATEVISAPSVDKTQPLTEPTSLATLKQSTPKQPISVEGPALYNRLVQQHGASLAELTPKGDLVHYITYPGENLYMVARWYTFDEHNATKIGRINGIQDPSSLSAGDTVVIPKYMLKNRKRLTEQGLQAMSAALSPKLQGKH